MALTRKMGSRAGAVLLALCGFVLAAPVQAQQAALPSSLRMVPGDAAAYSASLRTREQVQAIFGSKAWARLVSLPVVKMGWQMVESEWANPDGKLAMVRQWYEQPGHAELVRFLGELFEEEYFTYSGKNSAEFLTLMQEVQFASQMGPLMQMMKNGPGAANRPDLQIKAILQALAQHPERLRIPDAVMGFKLTRTKSAQFTQWMAGVDQLSQMAPPLRARMAKVQIQGAPVYTLTLDGSMIPWEHIPIAGLEDQPGEFEKLEKRLKEMKLTIGLTLRGNYLLLGIGEDLAGLRSVGATLPKRLSERSEFAPLAKFSDRKLTSVSYVSKAFVTALGGGNEVENLSSWLDALVKDADLPPEKLAKIKNDIKSLTAGLKLPSHQPGAAVSFSFLSKRGIERYSYDWSKGHGLDGSKSLTLLEHVGSQPLGFAVSREAGSTDELDLLARLIKLGHAYFDDLVVPQLPAEPRQHYEDFMKEGGPLFKRLYEATRNLLLPALDGQGGLVLDAKLKSKQWHKAMPPAANELPMLEVALTMGVKDSAKLKQAFQEYREVFNGLVDAIAKQAPGDFPDLKIPDAKTRQITGGTLYFYPVPEHVGLDPRIMAAAGISDRVAVFALSQDHVQRLLAATPWKDKGGPLANLKKPLASADYFDCAGLIDLIGPWVEYGLTQAHQGREVIDQVHAAMEILKCIRSHAGATYLENGVVVTHGELIVRDLEK